VARGVTGTVIVAGAAIAVPCAVVVVPLAVADGGVVTIPASVGSVRVGDSAAKLEHVTVGANVSIKGGAAANSRVEART